MFIVVGLEDGSSIPSLEAFKAKSDGSLSNLRDLPLPIAGGLELDYLKGSLQLKPFYDSIRSCAYAQIKSAFTGHKTMPI